MLDQQTLRDNANLIRRAVVHASRAGVSLDMIVPYMVMVSVLEWVLQTETRTAPMIVGAARSILSAAGEKTDA